MTSSKDASAISHCVGRLTLNLPHFFVRAPATTGYFKFANMDEGEESIDLVVEEGSMTESKFEIEVQKKIRDLRSAADETINIVKYEKRLSERSFLIRVQEIEDAYRSEIIFLKGSNLVTAKLDSFANQYEKAENHLMKLVEVIEDGTEIPSHQGLDTFCFGPLVIRGEFREEIAQFLYRSGDGVDFSLNIDTFTSDDPTSLLNRVSGEKSLLTIFQVKHKVLRARELTVAGMNAEEWLSWARTGPDENQHAYGFAVETRRSTPGKLSPRMQLYMDSAQLLVDGTPTTTTISDNEAIQLWDKVVKSIRPVGE